MRTLPIAFLLLALAACNVTITDLAALQPAPPNIDGGLTEPTAIPEITPVPTTVAGDVPSEPTDIRAHLEAVEYISDVLILNTIEGTDGVQIEGVLRATEAPSRLQAAMLSQHLHAFYETDITVTFDILLGPADRQTMHFEGSAGWAVVDAQNQFTANATTRIEATDPALLAEIANLEASS